MAEENEETEEGKKKGGSKLLLWLLIVVFAIGGGVATPMLIAQINSPSNDPPGKVEYEPDPDEEVVFIEFDEVTVNLDEARFSKFLRMNFSLQVAKSQKEEIEKSVTAKKAVFKNWIQTHLSEKTQEDLRGKFGRNQVRREMLDFFNEYLFEDGYEKIQDILFNEFYIQ